MDAMTLLPGGEGAGLMMQPIVLYLLNSSLKLTRFKACKNTSYRVYQLTRVKLKILVCIGGNYDVLI